MSFDDEPENTCESCAKAGMQCYDCLKGERDQLRGCVEKARDLMTFNVPDEVWRLDRMTREDINEMCRQVQAELARGLRIE